MVNVTINETLDARSQVEQHDRKGIGMAIGPAGISAGVFHHVVTGVEQENSPRVKVYPGSDASGAGDTSTVKKVPYQIFRYPKGFNGEFLSLGNWIAISGAAFSTSLGSRTSLGFSFLAGLANVRLSYWWDSGVEPLDLVRKRLSRAISKQTVALVNRLGKMLFRRAASESHQLAPDGYLSPEPTKTFWLRLISGLFQFLFTVQSFLLDELFARFHGTARRWWPLSDGGHFENMGGYELIRRRLPMIVIVDAEADPEYTFEGLANLIRKARLDFGAEIRFLREDKLTDRLHPGVRDYFGTLEQLRRGTWVKEPVEDPNASKPATGTSRRERLSINPVDEESLSLAHVALAEVSYTAPDGKGILLYIKPTLMGDEPADVHRYHTEHPSFPHETTAQQFFDEAQWESYRRLGEHIADKIFRDHDDENVQLTAVAGKFWPHMFEG